MAELRPHIDEIRSAGVDLAIIGSGSPFFGHGFRERLQLDVPVLSDQKLEAYGAAKFRRDLGGLLHPGALFSLMRALRGGHKQGKTQGDALQQGGVLLVRPDGSVAFSYASRHGGDHPPVEVLVAQAKKLAA